MRIFHYILRKVLLLTAVLLLFMSFDFTGNERDFIFQVEPLEGNHIRAWISSIGIFNNDCRTLSGPGFEWPAGEHKFAVYTTGLSIAAYVNGQLREASALYSGEYITGYIADSAGIPVPKTDNRFKIFSVKRTDNWINNPYWLNWGLMVPFGAPYVDVDNNGIYDPLIDTPGVKGAEQTIFACLTDGFYGMHSGGTGFGGGTLPLYAEVHLTAWCYNISGLEDVQFLKWIVINKSKSVWDSTYFSLPCDPDLGNHTDDYIGCDTARNMGYCYNYDNEDENWPYAYGLNPPAVGFDLLRGPVNKNVNPPKTYYMTCFGSFDEHADCEHEPFDSLEAYWYMKGYKLDGTPWLNPLFNPPIKTKFIFSGDPETHTGWTEYSGRINNCYGDTTGYLVPSPAGDKKFVMSSGSGDFKIHPGDTQTVMIAQFIARGTSNLNSVTKLKQLDDFIQAFVDNGFVIGVEPISNNIPGKFILHQNYPNPFNPVTKMKFEIPYDEKSKKSKVKIVVYDVLGKQAAALLNEKLSHGTYEVDWDATNHPSGVYFYRLITDDVSITKKMVLLK